MARTVRSTHLAVAVICLAVLHLLAHATTNTPTYDAALLLRASDAPPMAAGWPSPSASSNASRESRSRPRCLDYYPVAAEPEEAMEPAAAAAATTSTTRAPPRPRFRGVHTHAAAAFCPNLPAPRSVTAPYKKTALLDALPLLAVSFLPPPVAALVALTFLATPALACSDDCYKLNHATCAIYPYDNETGTVDRSRRNPDRGLGAVCLHQLCHADSDTRLFSLIWAQKHGRADDPLHIYCTVRTLEAGDLSMLPWRNSWRVHLPVADPGASGGDICYVELAHLEYREGYYIRCPAGGHHQTYCTEFPEEEIAAAVWDHRSLTYRATVGPRYATYQDKYLHLYDHDEL